MIRVTPAPEPAVFDGLVRRPGLSAINELIGRAPLLRRPGPRRRPVASQQSEISPADFPPLWRAAIPLLRDAYEGRCAYLATFIEPGTGQPTVDHFVPKSKDWRRVYEWSNFRLCAAVINGTKGERALLDPFEIETSWFALEFVSFSVIAGAGAPAERLQEVKDTLEQSGINARECRKLREQYVTDFENGEIELSYLERRAPFVAGQLRLAGRIV
jgi:hypothetical protein